MGERVACVGSNPRDGLKLGNILEVCFSTVGTAFFVHDLESEERTNTKLALFFSFDEWVEQYLIHCFNNGEKSDESREYFLRYAEEFYSSDETKMSIFSSNPSLKRMYSLIYVDFIIGVDGSMEDCLASRNQMKAFCKNNSKCLQDWKR